MRRPGMGALAAIAALIFLLAVALLWLQQTGEGAPLNASAYGTVFGTVTWEYGDIASNYRCVGTYPCAGCAVRFYRGNTLVKEVLTSGASLGKTLGCPQYSEGAGAFSADVPAGDYRISVASPGVSIGEGSANVKIGRASCRERVS
jgi:fructose-specific phosphotransferase system IIC component